jgi:hypothetical protein
MDLWTFAAGVVVAAEVAGAASVREGVESGGTGFDSGIAAGMAAGELVAGAFVVSSAIWPGPGMLVFVSDCARRRFAQEKKHQRATKLDRQGLPPHEDVKKVIS